MITVTISINGSVIYARTARNTSVTVRKGKEYLHKYELDDGRTLFHNRSKGAVALSKKMLGTIKDIAS